MGGAFSKSARRLPTTPKPTRSGTRHPGPGETVRPQKPALPLATETRPNEFEHNPKELQFLSNLSKIGQVKVDHHMQTIRPAADRVQRGFQARLQSEAEASSSRPSQNHLTAPNLHEMLESRKSIKSTEELEDLAKRSGIDFQKLASVARYVNTPSVEESAVRRTVGPDGQEEIALPAIWVDAHGASHEKASLDSLRT